FGQRLQTETTGFVDGILAYGADRTGYHSDAIPTGVSATVQIETAGVFQCLALRDERAQVADFRVTGYRTDPRIREWLDQTRERIALTLCVGVDENNNAVTGCGQTAL